MDDLPRWTIDTHELRVRLDDIKAGYFALDAALRALAESTDDADDQRPEWVKLPGDIQYRRDHYEDRARDPSVASDIRRAYLSGALLSFGDLLADEHYYDRSPEFEFVRHIRNAVAHGNVFEFKDYHLAALEKFPAHLVQSDGSESHAIKEKVNLRECLFGFLGPNQVLEAMDAAVNRLDELQSPS